MLNNNTPLVKKQSRRAVSVLPIAPTDDDKKQKKPKTTKKNAIIGIVHVAPPLVKPRNTSTMILHLRCCLRDLDEYNHELTKYISDPLAYNPTIPPVIVGYADTSDDVLSHQRLTFYTMLDEDKIEDKNNKNGDKQLLSYLQPVITESDMKEKEKDTIHLKLKTLKIQLCKGTLPSDKKSACFWCTCDYDNPACYIPKYEEPDMMYGYGSFCRPECATAYLMAENVNDSVKFERYHLLNKVYGGDQNVKPAPDPHYILDKFFGNLTIQEYRQMLKSQHLLTVLEKPMGRVLPELHDDVDYKSTSSVSSILGKSGYSVLRESERVQGPSKTSIIRDKFGM